MTTVVGSGDGIGVTVDVGCGLVVGDDVGVGVEVFVAVGVSFGGSSVGGMGVDVGASATWVGRTGGGRRTNKPSAIDKYIAAMIVKTTLTMIISVAPRFSFDGGGFRSPYIRSVQRQPIHLKIGVIELKLCFLLAIR